MSQGLDYVPRPYISRILVEAGRNTPYSSKSYVDLYGDYTTLNANPPKDNKLQITFDLAFKMLYPSTVDNIDLQNRIQLISSIKKTFNNMTLLGLRVTSPKILRSFLGTSDKNTYFLALHAAAAANLEWVSTVYLIPDNLPETPDNLADFVYYDGTKPTINIPHRTSDIYSYPTTSSGNPDFLAYIFMPAKATGLLFQNVFVSEIIFKKGQLVNETTYFIIGDTYSIGDPMVPGNVFSLLSTTPQAMAVKKQYGSPGTLWCGPVYTAAGTGNFMAGASFNALLPCPKLKLQRAKNKKLTDFRVKDKIKEIYSYQLSTYEKSLAFLTTPTYSNFKQNQLIDNFNKKNSIFTELNYSVRTLTSQTDIGILPDHESQEKINLFFGLDRVQLLKNFTPLPALLDRLVFIENGFVTYLVQKINFTHFEIKRIDTETGVATTVLLSDNGNYFDDTALAEPDHKLSPVIPRGTRFRRMSKVLIKDDDPTITFYEFRDGDIDVSKYDNHTFKYSIKLVFQDPLMNYISMQANKLGTIIENLDELLFKTSQKIFDKVMGKNVNVYDTYYKKLNPLFINKAMTEPETVTFNFVQEGTYRGMPQSIVDGFILTSTTGLENLSYLLLAIGDDSEDVQPMKSFAQKAANTFKGGTNQLYDIAAFFVSTTTLFSTDPTLLEQARSLLVLFHSKLLKILSIYQRRSTLIADSPSANLYNDYLKSQGRVSEAKEPNIIQYEETFKEEINLRKAKNHFDWLRNLGPSVNNQYNLKTINNNNYVITIQNCILYLLGTRWQTKSLNWLNPIGGADDMDTAYSFLPPFTMNAFAAANPPEAGQAIQVEPQSGKNTFKLFDYESFKNVTSGKLALPAEWEVDFEEKFYQVMRNILFDRHSNTLRNITIPEIESFFGIRGPLGVNTANYSPFNNMTWGEINQLQSIDALKTLDNFGTITLATEEKTAVPNDLKGGGPGAYGGDLGDSLPGMSYGGPLGVSPSAVGKQIIDTGGSTESSTKQWGGVSPKFYDIKLAKKIINLIFSDNTSNYRDLNLFAGSTPFMKERVTAPWYYAPSSPAPMNLLSNLINFGATDIPGGSSKVNEMLFSKIFNTTDLAINWKLRLENYHLYILYLSLFAKVEYLQGFEEGSPGDESLLTPTSFFHRRQIKAPLWKPITKPVLEGLQPGRLLACRLRLYDSGGANLIDSKYVQMFMKYYDNNQYFYISTLGAPQQTPVSIGETAQSIAVTNTVATLPPGLVTAPPGPAQNPWPDEPAASPVSTMVPLGTQIESSSTKTTLSDEEILKVVVNLSKEINLKQSF